MYNIEEQRKIEETNKTKSFLQLLNEYRQNDIIIEQNELITKFSQQILNNIQEFGSDYGLYLLNNLNNNDNDGYFNYFFTTYLLGKFCTVLDSKPKHIERPKIYRRWQNFVHSKRLLNNISQ